jgi:dinuclear metal center YbgI/SA1388 family protein
MAKLAEVVAFMDRELRVPAVPDYPNAYNGLQLENPGEVTRIAAAVDACEPVIEAAAGVGADLLIVHHGLFWNSPLLTGGMYRKVRCAMERGLAIYSAHLPLDVHPILGNNILLAKQIGLKKIRAFPQSDAKPLGVEGTFLGGWEELMSAVSEAVGGRVHVCRGSSRSVERVAVVTGGAGSEVARVAAQGIDTFITGEGPHWSYTLAEELGVNILYAGHYATETFGVRALAQRLARRFRIPWGFIDHPTGL